MSRAETIALLYRFYAAVNAGYLPGIPDFLAVEVADAVNYGERLVG